MKNVASNNQDSIQATHEIKAEAAHLRSELEKNRLQFIGEILNKNWENKKKMADGITNRTIDLIYQTAMESGSKGGKISGAGGGGFILGFTQDWITTQQLLSDYNLQIVMFL